MIEMLSWGVISDAGEGGQRQAVHQQAGEALQGGPSRSHCRRRGPLLQPMGQRFQVQLPHFIISREESASWQMICCIAISQARCCSQRGNGFRYSCHFTLSTEKKVAVAAVLPSVRRTVELSMASTEGVSVNVASFFEFQSKDFFFVLHPGSIISIHVKAIKTFV